MLQTSSFYHTELFQFTQAIYPEGDRGKLFRPAFIYGSSDVRGLVFMAHGELSLGYDEPYKTRMDHLGRILSELGFVCISVQPRALKPGTTTFAKGTVETYLRHLINANDMFSSLYIKGKPIALIGHSQAGSAAVTAGQLVQQMNIAGYKKVDAIVSLAGTEAPGRSASDAYLAMRGSLDRDLGAAGEQFTVAAYDHLTSVNERYFLWMHGCNHKQYTYSNKEYETDPQGGKKDLIRTKAQNIVTAQHTAMFLLWKLAAKAEYRPVFIGDEYIKLASTDAAIQADFTSLLRVFPRSDFFRPLTLGSLPGGALFQQMLHSDKLITSDTNPAPFGPLQDLEPTCKGHEVAGFVVGWDLSRFQLPRLRLTCNPAVMSLAIKAIEFHAVWIAEKSVTDPQSPMLVRAYLWHGAKSEVSKIVPVLIEPPWSGDKQASILSTVRIPIAMFGLDDLQRAAATTFIVDFSKADRPKGLVALTGFRANMK